MIIIIVVILGFIGLCLYGIFMPKFMVKQGRMVDARVISCESKMVQLGDETGSYYEVTVDFYGIHGETIQKKFKSEEYHEVGAVLRSRYIDKTGRFMQEADKDVKNNSGLWVVIGFLVFVLVLILSIFLLQDEEGELPGWFGMGFGYFISILFMVVGFSGMKNSARLKKNSHRMQAVPGYPVDYAVNHGGEISKEEEKSSHKLYLVFGFMGLAVFLLLLAGSTGLLKNSDTAGRADHKPVTENTGRDESSAQSNQDESKLMVYIMYPVGEEKFSYSIEITESGEGSMILFPSVTVSGKGVDQYIDFKLSISDIVKIGSWIEEADVENLNLEDVDVEGMTITVYVTEGEEQYDGRGTLDMQPYGALYELLSEIVPADVWDEMQERETEYFLQK